MHRWIGGQERAEYHLHLRAEKIQPAPIGRATIRHASSLLRTPIKHDGKDLFEGMPNPFAATRYHSLVIKKDTLPDCLEITAETDEGEIMGVRHKDFPIWGVQFHPESILTESGRTIVKNFLKLG